MSWIYEQSSGRLTDPSGALQGKGYSGQPPHSNSPADENLEGLGPIPCGNWIATGVEVDNPKLGPFVIILTPDPSTRARVIAMGRDPGSFRMHGERIQPPPGYASDGCIVMSRDMRELYWNSSDREIEVVSGE